MKNDRLLWFKMPTVYFKYVRIVILRKASWLSQESDIMMPDVTGGRYDAILELCGELCDLTKPIIRQAGDLLGMGTVKAKVYKLLDYIIKLKILETKMSYTAYRTRFFILQWSLNHKKI